MHDHADDLPDRAADDAPQQKVRVGTIGYSRPSMGLFGVLALATALGADTTFALGDPIRPRPTRADLPGPPALPPPKPTADALAAAKARGRAAHRRGRR